VTRRLCLLTRLADLRLLLLAQLDLQRSNILLDPRNRSRARDGEEVVSLSQNPRQSQLTGGAVLLLRNLGEAVHKLEVLGEVLGREARCECAEVALFEVVGAADLAAEHAAADGGVGDDGYAQLAGGLEEADLVGFNVETEGRVPVFGRSIGVAVVCVGSRGHSLDLDGVDVNNLAGPPESLGADLRETKVLDFSFVLELKIRL
jgi:hypothetical protein